MPFDRVSFVNAGYCTQLGYFAGSARRGPAKFHSVFLLLEHAQHGASLIDTGYGPWFLEATRTFPGKRCPCISTHAVTPRQSSRSAA
jgi:hypothetical protein